MEFFSAGGAAIFFRGIFLDTRAFAFSYWLMHKNLSKIKSSDFEAKIGSKDVGLYILKNRCGMEMSVTNFGARVVELFVPDRRGNFDDVVLGHNTLDKYVNYKGERFLGASIGRFGNRIAGSRFKLGGREYLLEANDGSNSLHGGRQGFDMKVWDVASHGDSEIEFRLVSPDGDGGFPGELSVGMVYRLTDAGEFVIEYSVTSDAETVVNLTHHSFFNLRGEGNGDINGHIMTIDASKYTPVDAALIPTGEIADVAGTPFDFTRPTPIGLRLDSGDRQLELARGYDHNWVLNKSSEGALDFAAEVFEPESGRVLTVFTTEPGMQFYGGNFFNGEIGKSGKPYVFRGTFALETQHFPDSPNKPGFPSTVLKPGEVYRHICKYSFSAR